MMRKLTIEQLKRQIARLPKTSTGRRQRYPRELKAAVLAIAEERKGEGWTQASVAAELGINEAMLSNWKRELRGVRSNSGKLRPVALLDESPQKEVPRALVLPSGVRIEGLELGELMALIRELT